MQLKTATRLAALLVLAGLAAFSLTRRDGAAVTNARVSAAEADAPKRILPATVSSVEWLVELVPTSRVVALPEQLLKYSSVMESDAWTGEWDDVPRYARFTSEVALGFAPDLVLVSPFTDAAMVERVRETGAEVLVLSEPTTWDEMRSACTELGTRLDAEESAARLLESLERRREALQADRVTPPLRVLAYGNYGSGAVTNGGGMSLDLAMRLAGLVNVAAEAGMNGPADLPNEVTLSLDFDAVLFSGTPDDSSSATAMRNDAALAEIEAVREERFLYLPVTLHVAGSQKIVTAAESLAEQARALSR